MPDAPDMRDVVAALAGKPQPLLWYPPKGYDPMENYKQDMDFIQNVGPRSHINGPAFNQAVQGWPESSNIDDRRVEDPNEVETRLILEMLNKNRNEITK